MKIEIVLGILFIHWVADFILQTDKQAKGKSKNLIDLLHHTFTYSFAFMIVGSILKILGLLILEPAILSKFVLITFILHTITDYFTSKLNSKLWEKGKTHNFFVSVGFDQWLHSIQLLLTFYYLNK